MPPKRKIRNLPTRNDQVNEMSFFDPVYQNNGIPISDDNESDGDGDDENDLLAEGIPRPTISKSDKNESNETLDNDTIVNSDHEQSSEVESSQLRLTKSIAMSSNFRSFQHLNSLLEYEKYKNQSIKHKQCSNPWKNIRILW